MTGALKVAPKGVKSICIGLGGWEGLGLKESNEVGLSLYLEEVGAGCVGNEGRRRGEGV